MRSEALYADHIDEITVQLAHHYTQADDSEHAVPYLLQAGDRARNVYAHQEAIDSYQRALEFLKEQGDYARAARTLMKLGLTYHAAFDFDGARDAYEAGFALWQRAGTRRSAALPPAPHALRASGGEPPSLDPSLAYDADTTRILDQLFSGLIALGPETEVVPDVAARWDVTKGGRRYVFHWHIHQLRS